MTIGVAKIVRRLCLALLLNLALAGCGSRPEPTPTPSLPPTLPVIQVTAVEVARAVRDDRFFADYGQSDLLISGTVSSVGQIGSDIVVDLATGGLGAIRCDLGQSSPPVLVGADVVIESMYPQHDATRDGSSLVLKPCRLTG